MYKNLLLSYHHCNQKNPVIPPLIKSGNIFLDLSFKFAIEASISPIETEGSIFVERLQFLQHLVGTEIL